jgi:hypothetical protein
VDDAVAALVQAAEQLQEVLWEQALTHGSQPCVVTDAVSDLTAAITRVRGRT